jgi:hypothetical protein
MKTPTADQAEQIADIIHEMTEQDFHFTNKISTHEAEVWVAYYLDAAAAQDSVIVTGVRDAFNQHKANLFSVRRIGQDGKTRTVKVTIP